MLKKLSVFAFVLVFLMGFVVADLAVLGTVYEGGLGGTLSTGATVSVTCNSTVHSDTTDSLGQYGVLFNTTTNECPDGSSMVISYSKSGFNTFNGNKDINYSTITNTGSLFSIVADHSLVAAGSTSGGGSSGRSSGGSFSGTVCYSEFWDCGEWTSCDLDGQQTRECVSNCGSIKTEKQFCEDEESSDSLSNESEEDFGFSEIDSEVEEGSNDNFFSAITGAVVGTLGAGGAFVAAVFIALVVAGFVFTRMKEGEEEDSGDSSE